MEYLEEHRLLVRWLLRRAQFLGNDAKPEDQQSRASDLQQEWEITKAPFYSEEIVWLYNECGLLSLIQGGRVPGGGVGGR